MFVDEANIDVTAGKGGGGCISWRREKFIPRGGPDGGDGGRGGNVVLIVDENTDTLSTFHSRKVFKAKTGENGAKRNRHGKDGADLFLKVPPGTQVKDGSIVIADLTNVENKEFIIASGGRGGFGNAHFKSSVRQRPDFAELGEPGEQKKLSLELKLVADIGIIGFPSVGKSSLIAAISSAKPKIAEYEFTTLVPNLGVVKVDDRNFVVCDVPGIIEGASAGKGLGHKFLKHIERCGILIHILDISKALEDGKVDLDVLTNDYKIIREELIKYSPTLADKKEFIVLNKCDLIPESEWDSLPKKIDGKPVFANISAATKTATDSLVVSMLPEVLKAREELKNQAPEEEEIAVLRPHEESNEMSSYTVEESSDGTINVTGKRLEQLVVMTDFNNEGSVRRFRDITERIGLRRALEKYRSEEHSIKIGEIEVTDHL
ncbi:GTPase ObgE [Candidatus Peregrinibacteria bacterium]|nr:GTPase ObgE [Candidatus Peregrinibacteria bacterium]